MFQDQETVKAAYYEISREEIADLLNYAYRFHPKNVSLHFPGSNISPRYAPSPKSTCGNRSSYAWNEFTDDNTIPDDQETLNRNHHVRNSIVFNGSDFSK
jgi:hypothetical protein